jgi:hypothetical protein
MHFLLSELAVEEGVNLDAVDNLLIPGDIYPVWSPYDAHEVAQQLMQLLEAEKRGWPPDFSNKRMVVYKMYSWCGSQRAIMKCARRLKNDDYSGYAITQNRPFLSQCTKRY